MELLTLVQCFPVFRGMQHWSWEQLKKEQRLESDEPSSTPSLHLAGPVSTILAVVWPRSLEKHI
jgi:hypothetical protein